MHEQVGLVNPSWVTTGCLDDHIGKISSLISQPKLNFQENNKFRLFIFLYTIDDLFAKFTQKWVAKLIGLVDPNPFNSYGFQKWDLGPMIGDFEALTATYFDLRGGIMSELSQLRTQRFVATVEVPKRFLYSNSVTYFGTCSFLGTMTPRNVPDKVTLPILLDEFGINLRLTDILDAVPFSFLLGHVLPNIAAFIDSQHPSRWFNANFTYSGWISSKLYCTRTIPNGWDPTNPTITDSSVFDRRLVSFKPSKTPELIYKFPGISGLLDVIALLGMRAKTTKTINQNFKLERRLTF
jgi:hypothetical protein